MRDNNSRNTDILKDKKEKKKAEKPAIVGTSPEDAINACFINRELSWLEFNLRVLQEAADHKNPLLERMKFLMIYESNLEEFFRVRVGILTHRDTLMPDRKDPLSGWTASEVLDQIMVKVSIQQALAEGIWKTLKEELKGEGVDILDFKKISKVDELMCKKHFIGFRHLLSPRIIEPGRPFPFLWNEESYVIAILGREPDPRIAVIPLFRFPPYTSFELDGRQKIVLTARLVRQFLPNLLKKEEVRESAVISVTRNADVFIEENADNEDFRDKMTKVLKKRRREMPVRLRVFGKLSPSTKALLAKKFNIPEQRIFTTSIPFDLSFRSAIREKEGYKYEERKPARNIGLRKGQYFDYLDHSDILISCPFQNMVPFVDLLYEAVDDPDVISIKITLYRLSSSSKVAAALAYAADQGKDVLCLLELRARFDEQSNIDYSEMLEDAGCRVIYGLPEQKVHSKLCLITRQSDGNLKHITQVGTGNYNEVTSEQYTDLSLITADEQVAQDAEMVFAALEAGEFPPEANALWVAPLSFKSNLLKMLDREIEKGPDGKVCIKVNSLNNREIMQKLIDCSKAGVKVELFIRGICCLRPGIPGMTDNITIKSVVGRWLEHSRIYQFGTGEDERIFIGSGDLLNRNLERRVEVFIEVRSEDTREQIHEILNAFRDDKEKARTMQPDGTYVREKGGKGTSSQERLYRYFFNRKISPWQKETQATVPETEETTQRTDEKNVEAEPTLTQAEPEPQPEAEPQPLPEPEVLFEENVPSQEKMQFEQALSVTPSEPEEVFQESENVSAENDASAIDLSEEQEAADVSQDPGVSEVSEVSEEIASEQSTTDKTETLEESGASADTQMQEPAKTPESPEGSEVLAAPETIDTETEELSAEPEPAAKTAPVVDESVDAEKTLVEPESAATETLVTDESEETEKTLVEPEAASPEDDPPAREIAETDESTVSAAAEETDTSEETEGSEEPLVEPEPAPAEEVDAADTHEETLEAEEPASEPETEATEEKEEESKMEEPKNEEKKEEEPEDPAPKKRIGFFKKLFGRRS